MSENGDDKEDENLVIVTNDDDCINMEAHAALSQVHNDEAEALLHSNEMGIRKFFQAKGCEEIGEALYGQGVTGSNLHMLSQTNMDKDLKLNLGQQLALKNFILRLKFIANSEHQVGTIWEDREFKGNSEKHWKEGKCYCCKTLHMGCCECRLQPDCSCFNEEEPELHELPEVTYNLNNTTLRLVSSTWADQFPHDEDRVKTYADGWCCDDVKFCAGEMDAEPQVLTTTDNIDLCTIQDVDNYRFSQKVAKTKPDFWMVCGGYEEEVSDPPAEIVVTYLDRAVQQGSRQKKATLKVDPERVDEISSLILQSKKGARKEQHLA